MLRGEKTAVPDFFGSSWESASGDEWPATQYSTRGGVDCSYETALDVRDGPNLYAYVMQNPWTGFDAEGLFTLDVHVDISMCAAKGSGMTKGLEMQGLAEGCIRPDIQQPLPFGGFRGVPVEHSGAAMDFLYAKNYIPRQFKAAGKAIDHAVDSVQHAAADKVFAGSAAARQAYDNYMTHTPSLVWDVMALANKDSYIGRLYATHMDSDSYQHFMAAPNESAQQVQQRAGHALMIHFASYQSCMKNGDAYEAGVHMGMAAHLIQDSHSRAHTTRTVRGIMEVGIFSDQSPPIHGMLDSPSSSSPEFLQATRETQRMVQMFRAGNFNQQEALSFFKLAPGARTGAAGASRPSNTPNNLRELGDSFRRAFGR